MTSYPVPFYSDSVNHLLLSSGFYITELPPLIVRGVMLCDRTLVKSQSNWQFTIQAITRCTVLALPQQAFRELLNQSQAL
ncbi:hypothetical protein [Nostoc sp.]|uniref:hypothetical protein n=1 Tax=Nostoc sp. TaxID=1180 RepID=UPI002FFCD73C